MTTIIIILLLVLGTISSLLLTKARPIARALWPGPTVKGPGDVYVQAFQVLLCLVVLIVIALVSSIAAFVLSNRSEWTIGQWLSAVPVVSAIATIVWARFRSQ